MSPLELFGIVLVSSLLSMSGTGNVPGLHKDLVLRGVITEQRFAESLAVGHAAPGPTGFWVVSLGYFVAGIAGAVAATLAVTMPPLLALGLDRLYRRVEHSRLVEGFVRGLGLSVVGCYAVVMLELLQRHGLDWASLLIAAVSALLGLERRIPATLVLLGAALVGIFVYR